MVSAFVVDRNLGMTGAPIVARGLLDRALGRQEGDLGTRRHHLAQGLVAEVENAVYVERLRTVEHAIADGLLR